MTRMTISSHSSPASPSTYSSTSSTQKVQRNTIMDPLSSTSSSLPSSSSLPLSSSSLSPASSLKYFTPSPPPKKVTSNRCMLIGPTAIEAPSACPCCNRESKEGRQTVGETKRNAAVRYGSLLDVTDDPTLEDLDDVDRMLPGILSDGAPYTISNVLVQGWVHKKGTGRDWMGSVAWKPRWTALAMAKVDGREFEIPLLLIYWYPTSTTPSSVIMLDSTVVLPEEEHANASVDTNTDAAADAPTEEGHCYRFVIRHAKPSIAAEANPRDSIVGAENATRTFSCPRQGRDAWVGAINRALLQYEKIKGQSKIDAERCVRSPSRRYHAITQECFPTNIHLSVQRRSALSPPHSPTSPRCRGLNIPKPQRKEKLLGEAFLIDDFARTALE